MRSRTFWQVVSLFHVTFVNLPPLIFVLWVLVFVGFGLLFGVLCLLSGAGYVDSFLISSSRDMTATVSSNAALEKKMTANCFVSFSWRTELV